MKKLLHQIVGLQTVPIFVASAALFFLMCLTFTDVILRSMFNAPIEAATELTRMCMAIMVFSILPSVSGSGQHIAVDLLDGFFMHPIVMRIKAAVINLACGGMLLWPAQRVYVLAERARSYGDVTEYLNIPQFYIAWFIAIMTFATAAVLIIRGLLELFAPKMLEPTDV
jgi:TRAP-type C4-dicarboxylate transport system permease small subunit